MNVGDRWGGVCFGRRRRAMHHHRPALSVLMRARAAEARRELRTACARTEGPGVPPLFELGRLPISGRSLTKRFFSYRSIQWRSDAIVFFFSLSSS